MKGLVRSCALIVVVSISSIGPGRAGSITYTASYSAHSGGPVIPQFDSALGQLLDVEATVTGSLTEWFQAYPTFASATYFLGAQVDLTREPSGFSFVTLGVSNSSTTYSGSLPGLLIVTGDYAVSTVLTSQLEPFYGTGQIGLVVFLFPFLSEVSPSGSIFGPIEAFGSGTETITYNFVVPEPHGLIMAGTAALVGLACWLRRRMPVRPAQT
jgi:hypothetical protein